MIVIQDNFTLQMLKGAHDVEIKHISHQQLINELTTISTNANEPLLNMMQGQVPRIGCQVTNRGVAAIIAQLVGAAQISCVSQYTQIVANPGVPVFVYIIQPLTPQVTNFEQHTVIYRAKLTSKGQ